MKRQGMARRTRRRGRAAFQTAARTAACAGARQLRRCRGEVADDPARAAAHVQNRTLRGYQFHHVAAAHALPIPLQRESGCRAPGRRSRRREWNCAAARVRGTFHARPADRRIRRCDRRAASRPVSERDLSTCQPSANAAPGLLQHIEAAARNLLTAEGAARGTPKPLDRSEYRHVEASGEERRSASGSTGDGNAAVDVAAANVSRGDDDVGAMALVPELFRPLAKRRRGPRPPRAGGARRSRR